MIEVDNAAELIRRWAGRSLPRRVMAHWLSQAAALEAAQPRWFTDDPARPAAVMRLHGPNCMVHGELDAVRASLSALQTGRLDRRSGWPDAECEQQWARAGRRELQLSRVTPATRAAALAVGFCDAPDAEQPHYSAHAWYLTGKPRFGERVLHPCRIVQGEELLPRLLENDRRDERDYLCACLRQGPSFVCEIGGEAVCWSCTHLGGAMGRIFTPPERRGQGYGKSLAALQVDTMLAVRGIAVASISVDNPASYRMLQALGARHIRGPMTWSTLL